MISPFVMQAIDAIGRAFWAAAGAALFALILSTFKKLPAAWNAIRAVTHDALYRNCRIMLHNGEVTKEEIDNLERLYAAYHKMGMNGTGEEMYQRCLDLPLKDFLKDGGRY